MGSAVRVTSAAEGLPRRRFTVAEVEAMVAAGVMEEDERVELIGGELVPMSPKGNHHEVMKAALLRSLVSARPDEIQPRRPRPPFASAKTPISSPTSSSIPARAASEGLTGANVLLVVEIADSSLRYDTGRKAALYASFGIRELWVIDAVRLTTRVFREPAADGYRNASDFGPADQLTPLIAPEAFALRLDELELS